MSDTLNYIQYLQQPELISGADKEIFHRWVNEYPYVPVFRILLAAKYQSENHPETAAYIEQAAFYAQDRKQLKLLLRSWQYQIDMRNIASVEENEPETPLASDINIAEENQVPVTEETSVPDTTEILSDNIREKDELTENEELQLQEIIQSGTTSTETIESDEIPVADNEEIISTPETNIVQEENIEEAHLTEENSIETGDSVQASEVTDEASENEITEHTDISNETEYTPEETTIDLTASATDNHEEEAYSTDHVISEAPAIPEETATEDISPESESIKEQEIIPEESILSTADNTISEEDDIAFLKSIGKYETPVTAAIPEIVWDLEAPVSHIPEISGDAVIDTGLVSADISWLTPWLEEFPIPVIQQKASIVTPVADIKQPETPELKNDIRISSDAIHKENAPASSVTDTAGDNVVAEAAKNSGTHSFDEWLSILEQKKQNPEEAPVFDLPAPEVFNKNEIQAVENLEVSKSDMETLEKENQPEEETSVKKLAAESVSFKQDMATETLAKLYIRQGKIDLAVSIYKQLIDKFPEKSSYFAGQINRLK